MVCSGGFCSSNLNSDGLVCNMNFGILVCILCILLGRCSSRRRVCRLGFCGFLCKLVCSSGLFFVRRRDLCSGSLGVVCYGVCNSCRRIRNLRNSLLGFCRGLLRLLLVVGLIWLRVIVRRGVICFLFCFLISYLIMISWFVRFIVIVVV